MENAKTEYNYLGVALNKEELFSPISDAYFLAPRKPNWALLQHASADGFDDRYEVQDVVLPAGTRLARYGLPVGIFTTDVATPYELLSLPYVKESMPYHEYMVSSPCKVLCIVKKGIVAPGFGSAGGAVQYKHSSTINILLQKGILEEDFTWLKK